jgi:hypothetical protein
LTDQAGVKVKGTLDTSKLDIHAQFFVRVPLWGLVQLGTFVGGLHEGIGLKIKFSVADGAVRLYIKDKDVRLNVQLGVKFIGHINDDVKLFTI